MATNDVISLNEAKDYLNISSSTSDAELGPFITAASQAWVNKVGPVAGSPTYSEWYDGGGYFISLRHTPVQSITSITEALTATSVYTLNALVLDGTGSSDAYGYTFDQETGLLTRRASGAPSLFAAGIRNIHVTYVAGYATVPEDIKLAIKDLVHDMWQSQRATLRGGEVPTPPSLWPRRAAEIASAYYVPGIA